LGDTEEEKVEDIKQAIDRAAASIQPFRLRYGGSGAFPSAARARVIWVGLKEGVSAVNDLTAALEKHLAEAGYLPEIRDFHPHLTIGRLRYPLSEEKILKFIEEEKQFETVSSDIEKIVLFQSTLTKRGAQHTELYEKYFGQ
jgi:RNA 2',3'-cyclic 3'-phosphodiesterase